MPFTSHPRVRRQTRRLVGAVVLLVLLFAVHPAEAQSPLSFFKNYFVTGDYVVRGVSLWRKGVDGKAVALIPALRASGPHSDGVPDRADIVAAFLYIQTAEKSQGSGVDHGGVHVKLNGFDFGPFADASGEPGSGTIAKPLGATSPCWSVGYPGGRRLVTYRADVLRFLPIDPATGKQALDVPHRIEVPDWGFRFHDDDENARESQDEPGPRAVGASLVVVYRDRTQPLRGVVLYDGAVTRRAYERLDQRLEGFYQSSTAGATARLTHVVGDGRPFLFERLRTAGEKSGSLGPIFTEINPFRSAQGPKWDNWTSHVPLPPDANAARVRVEPLSFLSDCTSWSAMVLSTDVQDTDEDGLLDEWEINSGLLDPNGQPLPDLAAMGADHTTKDLFVEIGFMSTPSVLSYGGSVKPAHSHLPSVEALGRVAEAFENNGVRVHFDVGPHYQNVGGVRPSFIVPWSADPFTNLARGGEEIDEMVTVCAPVPEDPSVCQFSEYPGTVGWKSGFRILRDQILSGPAPLPDGTDPCDAPGSSCVRRFDRNRKDTFRYALFAHAIGMPKDPCFLEDAEGNLILDSSGSPISDLTCNTPDFHVPRTNSGIGDFPGGDVLITLGAFDDSEGLPIGTGYMQAGTLMHELGHTFELTHAGPPAFPVREPNCKPNYLSVMNYLFQLRGLLDASAAPQVDYSSSVLGPINEIGLFDAPFAMVPYRTGFYAPLQTSYLNGFAPAATRHCDGSELLLAPDGTPLETRMVRVDTLGLAGDGIDWNADGVANAGGVLLDGMQDVNFNGATQALNAGADDWSYIRLNELGGRRNVGGFYLQDGRFFVGPLSLDVGRGDIGRGDIGRGDIGRGDIGRGDIGRGDIGRGDIGRGDIGRGDIGRGDIGRGDIGRGDIGRGDFGGGDLDVGAANEVFNGELDFETFIAATGNAPTPANALQACTTDSEGRCVADGGVPVRLSWLAPNVGQPVAYQVYRFSVAEGAPFPPDSLPAMPIATVVGYEGPVPTTFLDESAANGVRYAYFIVANFADGQRSGVSNFAVIDTPAVSLPAPVPLVPNRDTPIAQNQREIGCALLPGPDASRGRGFQIAFDWEGVEIPNGVASYRLVAGRAGAERPIVDRVVETSHFTQVSCNAFVADSNLTGWEWRVQAIDGQGRTSEWSAPLAFAFEPCVLDDGRTSCSAPGSPAGSGNIVDPAGDVAEGDPDLVSGSVEMHDEYVVMTVRFAAGTFNPQTTVVQFSLDMDQDPETGHQGTDSACLADNGILGVEYIVDFGSTAYGDRATVRPFAGSGCNQFGRGTSSEAGSVTVVENGLDVVLARSLLGESGGLPTFKVVSFRFLGEGFSGVLDRMTDAGEAPGQVIGR